MSKLQFVGAQESTPLFERSCEIQWDWWSTLSVKIQLSPAKLHIPAGQQARERWQRREPVWLGCWGIMLAVDVDKHSSNNHLLNIKAFPSFQIETKARLQRSMLNHECCSSNNSKHSDVFSDPNHLLVVR